MKEQVLLLDDDPAMLHILEGVLVSAGYRCHTATHAEQALAIVVANEAISVVLSDIYMPGMTGFQFVDRINALALDRPAPRVVLLTAQPSLQTAVEALRLGVCDFLTKPVRPAELLDAVRRAISRAAQDQMDQVLSPEVARLIEQSQELTERLRRLAVAAEPPAAPAKPAPLQAEPVREAAASSSTSVIETIEMLRELRTRYAQHKLDDVAWDLLLDLARAERQHQRLSVSGLMISNSNVSSTTLLRRVNELTTRGYMARIPDPKDARRDFVSLTPKAHEVVTDYLEQANGYLSKLGPQGGAVGKAQRPPAN
ncbi:response regulator [Peristeroidobacter soli]|jgi:CheY-like chemotaxis protein|uniref:response regulator n=1 Tax=Peristeroidobacter soli TaxID=2497877 RepID=UPI00101BE064|nr:response regulator [Peristeroidobacter soli]